MVQNCCVYLCFNKFTKGTTLSFHCFPWKKPEVLERWIAKISRRNHDGSEWRPTKNDRVCSDHFSNDDYYQGLQRRKLREHAVPTIFPNYPAHKQHTTPKRSSPKKRAAPLPLPEFETPAKTAKFCDHTYSHISIESHLEQSKKELSVCKEKLSSKQQELCSVKKKLARRDHKITTLLDDLKKRDLLDREHVDIMKENFTEETFTIIENELKASHTSKNNMRFSEDLKSFAVSLHVYSAQAYRYVRKFLHLPHCDTVRRWAASHKISPGFLSNVINNLKLQLEKDELMKDVCLMFDSMSIRKQVVYDPATQTYAGYVNHGNLQVSSPDTLASESLTFLVVGQKRYFKHPIGYFLVDKITAFQQAQIVKDGIIWLTEAGFNVQAVVCDGAYVNQATATALGCSINYDIIDPEFPHPLDSTQTIPFVFDACHLLKNIRNALGDLKCLRYGEEKIEWSYIVSLHKLQLETNLNLANKLKGKHIDYLKNKMKVSLAAQTLSSSVASAIDFLRDDLKLPEFAGSEATCKFLYLFDKLFDLCNSSSFFARGLKSAITKENLQSKLEFIQFARNYIHSLCDNCNKPILKSRRKTGFIGFLATLTSIEILSRRLLNQSYKYVLTFRLSQDHLETFFSRIRRRGGWNNNPNVIQFKNALRSLLLKNGVLSSESANCQPVPDAENTAFSENSTNSLLEENVSDYSKSNVKNQSNLDKKTIAFIETLTKTSEFHSHILFYMSGFICRKLREKLKCAICSDFLGSINNPNSDHPAPASFTVRKDRGRLLYACNDLYKIVVKADEYLRHLLTSDKAGPLRAVTPQTTKKVTIKVIEELGSSIFLDLDQHAMDCHLESEDSHTVQIIKEAVSLFCRTIFFHHGKLFTDRHIHNNACSVRHKHNKIVLFKNI